jgi:hypothetical protein
MNGPKFALWGIIIGLFIFFALGPILASKAWLWIFAAFYVGFPISGLVYDLKSGDFEEREGYSP